MNIHQATTAGKRVPGEAPSSTEVKSNGLVMRGSGTHSAITWGILDQLLDEPRLDFGRMVATSAGTMNAAVMTYGLIEGGRKGAQRALANFWRRVSHAAAFSAIQYHPLDHPAGGNSLKNALSDVRYALSTSLLPQCQLNPVNFVRLRHVLEQSIDFGAFLRTRWRPKLQLYAADMITGKTKLIADEQITCDAVVASICAPLSLSLTEIGQESYINGGTDNGCDLEWVRVQSSPDNKSGLDAEMGLNADWGSLTDLRDAGRGQATIWLEENLDRCGNKTTATPARLIVDHHIALFQQRSCRWYDSYRQF
jgi:NTE family protein